MSDVQIVFDIGGTNSRVAVVRAGVLGSPAIFPTAQDPEEGLRNVCESAQALAGDDAIREVCGCVAGTVMQGVVVGANNLLLWNGFPLVQKCSEALGTIPVTIFNDAELAGMGEFFYGAGTGYKRILYVTVSTGVGMARIVDGRITHEKDPLIIGEELISLLDLEHRVSGTAVKNTYGIDPKDLTDQAIREGLADCLASGLKNSVSAFRPDALVLGGSMITGQNSIPLDRIQRQISVPIKKATLGDVGGLWGAVAYLNQKGTP